MARWGGGAGLTITVLRGGEGGGHRVVGLTVVGAATAAGGPIDLHGMHMTVGPPSSHDGGDPEAG